MKYIEKLKKPLWYKKRQEILERDNYSCQCCGLKVSENWIEDNYVYFTSVNNTTLKIDSIENNYNESYKVISSGVEYLINNIPNYLLNDVNIDELFIVTHKKREIKALTNFVSANESNVLFQSNVGRNISSLEEFRIISFNFEDDYFDFSLHPYLTYISTKSGINSLTNSKLNVHHKKYKFGAEPWDYENNDLVTLCTHCHMLVHIEFKIPLYKNGIVSHFLKQCKRCHGERIFPEYEHVQNGYCFRCDGVGFEPYENDYYQLFI